MALRILASVILLFSVLFMPFWVSVVLALAGMVYFPVFWEAALLFLLSDLLYGVKNSSLMIFTSFIVAMAILAIVEFLKRKTKFYQ